jgi:hypothetical protein
MSYEEEDACHITSLYSIQEERGTEPARRGVMLRGGEVDLSQANLVHKLDAERRRRLHAERRRRLHSERRRRLHPERRRRLHAEQGAGGGLV